MAFLNRFFSRRNQLHWGVLLAAISLAGCASFTADTTLPVTVVASPNQDVRRPTMVVLHYTTNDDVDHSIDTLTSAIRKVSAHYLIARDGKLYQLVPEDRRAWHAGQSYWAGEADVNSRSIGIELDNNGYEPFEEQQINTLLSLLQDIQTRHKIKPGNVVGHSDVSPGRKIDPGAYFPWQRLAKSGFGLWCDTPEDAPATPDNLAVILTALGYDPRTAEASRQAFRAHYMANEDGTLNEDPSLELRLAQCLYNQKTK